MLFYLSSGSRADDSINTCVGEEIELECPSRTQAIENNEYEDHFWYVTDPNDSDMELQPVCYCNSAKCTTYNLTKFAQRIKIKNPVPGKTSVTQLWKDDVLTFICKVELKGNRKAPEDQINVSSSVKCKWIDL